MRFSFRTGINLFPFRKEIRRYNTDTFKNDLIASISVALLAIPQAVAYAILAGLPPIAGLFSAIFGTIFTSGFISSRHLVSGPTTATAILIQTIIADIQLTHFSGVVSPEITYMILAKVVFIIGAIQIAAGFFNVAKILQFVSRSVILGYFVGVAVAILVSQLFPLFNIPATIRGEPTFFQLEGVFSQIGSFDPVSLAVGLFCLGFLLAFRKKVPYVPDGFILFVLASILAYFINQNFQTHVKTLNDSAKSIHNIYPTLQFPLTNLSLWIKVFPAALAIALLGIFEVFSVSRVICAKSGQHIRVNQEMFGVGVSNFLLSFIHRAMPASASISRSFVNWKNGGKTRFSAIYSSIIVAIITFFAWPYFSYVPLVALSAILIRTSFMIIDIQKIKFCLRATKGDKVVFFLTFISCLFFRLDIAFFIGIIISIFFYLQKAASPKVVEYAFNIKGRLTVVAPDEKKHRHVRIIGIGGELFFGVADLFQDTMRTIAKDTHVKVIVIRLNGVHHVDASFCLVLLRLNEYLQTKKKHLVITGITPEVFEVFDRSSLLKKIGKENLFLTHEEDPQLSTWKGCLRAKELIQQRTNN